MRTDQLYEVPAAQQPSIRGNDVTYLHLDNVIGYDQGQIDWLPLPHD